LDATLCFSTWYIGDPLGFKGLMTFKIASISSFVLRPTRRRTKAKMALANTYGGTGC
jgi:hypothetical protein